MFMSVSFILMYAVGTWEHSACKELTSPRNY